MDRKRELREGLEQRKAGLKLLLTELLSNPNAKKRASIEHQIEGLSLQVAKIKAALAE